MRSRHGFVFSRPLPAGDPTAGRAQPPDEQPRGEQEPRNLSGCPAPGEKMDEDAVLGVRPRGQRQTRPLSAVTGTRCLGRRGLGFQSVERRGSTQVRTAPVTEQKNHSRSNKCEGRGASRTLLAGGG